MISCKKLIILTFFMATIPLTTWSEVPVVDDSDNFATMDDQQARIASVDQSKYGSNYDTDSYNDEVALAKDDQAINPNKNLNSNASLVEKVQNLQREVQELRGQLEVQAHDLKLLQQQQMAFYKDLDARLNGKTVNTATVIPTQNSNNHAIKSGLKSTVNVPTLPANSNVSRINPADEQISYFAAYEFVKNRRYDEALESMSAFVQKYPRGGYSANAQYWLGELYLLKKEYTKAIDHFTLVLQQFPGSPKSAASMLKVGYSYAAMGNNSEAKKYLQQVVQAYPDTPTAQLANSKLQTI